MPAAIPLAIIGSTIGGVASAAIGSSAAGNAANAQVSAANNAAALQHQDAQAALNFNQLQYGNSLALGAPYYNSGVAANSRLDYLMGLTPNTGLPPGVTNPNAPSAAPNTLNASSFDPSALANLRGLRAGAGNGVAQPFQAEGGTVPINNPSTGGVTKPFQDELQSGMRFGDTGANNGGILPSQTGTASTGGVTTATTNQGGTGQVPRTDGGGDPNNPTAPTPGGSFGSLATPFGEQWQAPTGVTEQNDPGYQFRIKQGLDAIQNSAAARGKLVSGDTAKGLNDYAQNSASNEFQNVYNRSLSDYTTRYNAFNQDQNTQFNRYATLAGIGQTSAGQLSAAGLNTAGNNANILLNSGAQIGNDLQNAGSARASGYVGGANAITGGISNVTNMATLLALLKNNPSASSTAGMGVF